MQLEPLLTSLGIPQFIPQLSEFRDEILREKAAELKSLIDTHAEELATIKADLDAKNALIDSAKNGIKSAIADAKLDAAATVSAIAEIVATAELPSIEKRKAALAAEIEAKKAELESLA